MTKVNFDSKTHTYKNKEGVVIPSVTQILSEIGILKGYKNIPEQYARRGSAVHRFAETLVDNPEMDLDTLRLEVGFIAEEFGFEFDDIVKHCQSIYLWLQKNKELLTEAEAEKMFINEVYAGTADVYTEKTIIDWKTSKKKEKWHRLQACAYMFGLFAKEAFVVYANEDGAIAEEVRVTKEDIKMWNDLITHYKKGELKKALKVYNDKKELSGETAKNLFEISIQIENMLETQKKLKKKLEKELRKKPATFRLPSGDGFDVSYSKPSKVEDTSKWKKWVEENHPDVYKKLNKFSKKRDGGYRFKLHLENKMDDIDKIIPEERKNLFWIYAEKSFQKNKKDFDSKELEQCKRIALGLSEEDWEAMEDEMKNNPIGE
jgi:hypothetical protein